MNRFFFRINFHGLLLFSFFYAFSAYSQQEVKQLTKAFDSVVGVENLPLINGTFHLNTFRVINEKNRYYNEDYQRGNVVYDDRSYYNVNLKYDLYEDVVIVQPFATSQDIGVNLIPEKTFSFDLDEKHFINLKKHYPFFEMEDILGFVEEVKISDKVGLFIKYFKDYREKSDRSYTYYEFTEDHDFYFFKDQNIREITSKRDVYKVFPELKEEIESFYKSNKELADTNEVLFFKKLSEFLSNRLKNNSF